MNKCPNCKNECSPNLEYKCKKCGEVFWRSKELFEEHHKEQSIKIEKQSHIVEDAKKPKKKMTKIDFFAILGVYFIVSITMQGRLGFIPKLLIVLVVYWIIKMIIISVEAEEKENDCPDCKPDEDYKCKSCGKIFWRSKELYEKNHKSQIPDLKEKEDVKLSNQLKIESKQNKNSKKKWIIVGIFLVVLIVATAITITLNTPNNEEQDISLKKTDKSGEYSEQIGSMYRNTKYKFRIKFPEGWKIEVGDGLHIVQKASFENSIISIIVQQLDLGINEGFSSIKDTGAPKEFIDTVIDGAKEKFSDVKIIDYGETKIDNEPAYWVEYSASAQILDQHFNMTQLGYFLAKGDTIYAINTGTVTDEYSKIKPLFTQTVGTFVFEDN